MVYAYTCTKYSIDRAVGAINMAIVIGVASCPLASRTKIAAALPLAKQSDGAAAVTAGSAVPPIDICLVLKMPSHPVGTGKIP